MKFKIVKSKSFKFRKIPEWEPYDGFMAAFPFPSKETEHMSVVMFKIDPGFSVKGTMSVEEIEYILEGSFRYTVKGKTFTAKEGDIVAIPKGLAVVFSTNTGCKCLSITYPHLRNEAVAKARVLSSGKSGRLQLK